LTSAVILTACGGSSGSGPPPPAATTSTFTVTLTAVSLDRSADQLPLAVDALPAEGATIRIPD
jgi:hypothetical protein